MLQKNNITAIFFDLDHTLWDFEKNSALTFQKIFEMQVLDIPLESFLRAYEPINHYYWKLYRENRITQEELRHKRLSDTLAAIHFTLNEATISKISTDYIKHLSSFSHLFEGTHSLLAYLKNKFKLHIITNGFESVQHHKIANSGLAPYFDQVFTAEKVGFKKPDSRIFKTALESTKTPPEQALMIGDSLEADILGALDNGMQAIHFNSHKEDQHDHCVIVNSLKEIHELFSETE